MEISNLVADSMDNSPCGVDNGLEMKPLSSDSRSDSVSGMKTPPNGDTDALVLGEIRAGSPEFPEAPPSSPMQVTAPGGGFGENSETIQSEGVRNLVQELQQMSHAQRQLQIIHQQQLQEQQQLENNLQGPSLSASGQQMYMQNGGQMPEGWHTGYPGAPPDGGYGWIVVLGCFICMVVVDGISFGFGVLLSHIQETFEEGKGKVALAGALTPGFYLLVGPLPSALCSRFSFRQLTIFGSVLSSVSVLWASYVQELWQFMILYGVLTGIGFGVIYITCFSVVGAWFQKKRAFATGSVVCGTGIGLALIGVVGPLLIREYTWRGALVVFSCMLAQGCVCGILFRPTEVHKKILKKDEIKKAKRAEEREKKRRKKEALREAVNGTAAGGKANGTGTANGKGGQSAGDDGKRKNRRRPKMQHRCSIMQKIIEDKERQRTTSSGSLNGCIITQDNQLIQPPEGYSDAPRISHNALNRLVESMRNRMTSEGRSRSRQNSMRQIVKESMPQMVADYVNQSQSPNQNQAVVVAAAAAAVAGDRLKPNGGSLPPSRPSSRHNSAVSLFHSTERVGTAAGRGTKETEVQRPLLLPLETGQMTGTSSGAATPSITASSTATPAPTLVSMRNKMRRSPAGSGTLVYSGSFAQLPPFGSRISTNLASPTSDMVSRQNSFLYQNMMPSEAADFAYMEQGGGPGTVGGALQEPRHMGGAAAVMESCWQMLTPSILLSPTFILLTVSSMLTMFGFLVPNILLVDYAVFLGYTSDSGAHLITYLGIANTVGRICTVLYITYVLKKEKPICGSLTLNNLSLILAGIITIVLPWSHLLGKTYGLLVAYAVVYGFLIAVFVSIRGSVVDDMFGAESLTNAFGYLLLFQGFAIIMGPPLFGWLVDRAQSQREGYKHAFILGGLAVLASGLLLLPLGRLAAWEKRRNNSGHCEEYEIASAVTGADTGLPGAYTPTGAGGEPSATAAGWQEPQAPTPL